MLYRYHPGLFAKGKILIVLSKSEVYSKCKTRTHTVDKTRNPGNRVLRILEATNISNVSGGRTLPSMILPRHFENPICFFLELQRTLIAAENITYNHNHCSTSEAV